MPEFPGPEAYKSRKKPINNLARNFLHQKKNVFWVILDVCCLLFLWSGGKEEACLILFEVDVSV